MKLLFITSITLSIVSTQAATIWKPASNALASASWDRFSYESPNQGDSGSQGPAATVTGALVNSSDLTTTILQGYSVPPGGTLGNPDTYYFHNGAAEWTVLGELSEPVSFVRISYSLLGFGGGAPSPYPNAPAILDASVINQGTYDSPSSTVFFVDLQLASPTTTLSGTFGDALFPGYPGSFRSVDGVQFEVFDTAPIPEPSSGLLLVVAAAVVLNRRARS